jgi:hypothetical protein
VGAHTPRPDTGFDGLHGNAARRVRAEEGVSQLEECRFFPEAWLAAMGHGWLGGVDQVLWRDTVWALENHEGTATMKRLLWAALLALPMLLLGQQRAAADGCPGCCSPFGCFPVISGWWTELKQCVHNYQGCHSCGSYGGCGSCGSCWGGGGAGCASCWGGGGASCASCGGNSCISSLCPKWGCFGRGPTGCCGNAPGPWYTYWPTGDGGPMTSPYATPGWVYDMHFQTPAPIPPYGAPAAYPSYWVGHY